MQPAQPLGDGVVRLGRRRAEFGGDRLGGLLKRGKMVRPGIEQIARLLIRQQDAAAGRQRDAGGVLARHAPGAVQRQHRACRRRTAGGERGDLCFGYRPGAQHGVGERLAHAGLELAFRAAGQRGQINPENLGQLDQQGGGDGALVVLDQVQVAGGDAQARRQRLLRQVTFGAQTTHCPADQGTGHIYNLYEFTDFTVNAATGLHSA
jgi:hypothetical protein